MKHAARFLFGAAIGLAVGYALTLFVRPASNGRRLKRPTRPPANNRDRAD